MPLGEPIQLAHEFIQNFIAQGNDGALLEAEIFNIVANPPAFFADELRAPLARARAEAPQGGGMHLLHLWPEDVAMALRAAADLVAGACLHVLQAETPDRSSSSASTSSSGRVPGDRRSCSSASTQ